MEITAIEASADLLKANEVAQLTPVQTSSAFLDVVLSGVGELNTSLVEANSVAERAALGENIPSHEIMIAMEKARLELNMAVQVRNKLLDVYQEITKMQI
ncbi:flagellar hook-basal body complex protein FliE [Pseudoalteromonas byunsanensis]|uniref:Flagellar hook-basal body complex protein FliE n=1 Tax=Pseudoalteromonas byunsanensis TaxID=327939 RepID=A0A1S1N7Y0_9GAMM|nr:flagellar hook-basal body complex protein FliE [Pseudoalteromonas byunsanensis]OHU97337.1 flagellar hook-basal body complex protein FliE [Pseudoalteromonas byunsanensis]